MGWDPLLSLLGNNFESIVYSIKIQKNWGDGKCSNAQRTRISLFCFWGRDDGRNPLLSLWGYNYNLQLPISKYSDI
jgi:hypothetical protein